ncbi:MAG: Ig-like domain-containing protein [Polyangiaceae bacterium]|nr:Ig-like domain-containing protein [Polyangiaceae bacterium]
MPSPRRAVPPLSLALLALSACAGSLAPKVSPRGTLEPGRDRVAPRDEGPFAVVQVSPSGEIEHDAELSVTWNRALRALGDDTAPPPVTLTPAVPGRWEWVGSRAARFVTKHGLPRATELRVEVPAGTRALDGSVLAQAEVVTLSTRRPRLVSSSPRDGATGLARDAKITLTFDQPIAADELARAVRLEGPGGKLAASIVPGETPEQAVLTPGAPLPEDAPLRVVVDATLRGVEGPLTAKKEVTIALRTFGPLVVAGLTCSERGKACRPNGWISLALSNRVKQKDLQDALQIEPPVRLRWPASGGDQLVSSVYLDGDFKAGRAYSVTVRPRPGRPLLDEWKQPLTGAPRLSFTMADHDPEVELGVSGTYLEASFARDVPVFSTNVPALRMAVAPLTIDEVLAQTERPQRRPDRAVDELAARAGATSTTASSGPKNRLARSSLPLARVLPSGRGAAELAVSWQGDGRVRARSQIVQVTDLGLTAKIDGDDGALVWVTRLSTGQPASDAEILVRGPGATAQPVKVDADGFARVTLPKSTEAEPRRQTIVARAGHDWVFREADQALDGYRYGAADGCRGCERGRALLFTDRGLYRPGDKVKLKGVVRDADRRGLTVPSGRGVEGVVRGPEGEELSRFKATLSSFGTFHEELTVPETAKLGSYQIELSMEGAEQRRAVESFEVAEFRPTELEVKVETDRRDYVRGDSLSCEGRGAFLFGAPMSGADAHLELSRARAVFTPPGAGEFQTSDDVHQAGQRDEPAREARLSAKDEKLDRAGKLSASVKLELPAMRGVETATCDVEVRDLSRQALSASATAFVHPGEVYLGVRSSAEGFTKAGDAVKAEVIAIEPSGKRRGGVRARVELSRRAWKVSRIDAGGGRAHTEVVAVDTPVASCVTTTDERHPATCALAARSPGFHVLRVTGADARGNPLAASDGVYVLGDGEASWAESDELRVELVPDKKSYKVGDTARVLVKSPLRDAEAWITLEREGVLSSERRRLSGATPTIEVKITEEHVPNIFLGVHLLRGRTKAPPASARKPDVGAPTFRAGFVPLVVDHEARRLAVRVAPRKVDHAPGERATVDVEVRDAGGRPVQAEITLYAVDEGVLSLVGYRTPDPVATFFAPRPLQVTTIESREDLARVALAAATLGPGLDKGMDGGGGGAARRDFRQTAVFLPSLRSDADGHATASFALPESLTSYRVMAVVAGADDRFGAAEARVVTSKPLMARPALPRVLRAGDSLQASVILTSKGAADGAFDVSLAADGLALDGPPKQRVELARGESKEARFPVRAPAAGAAKLTFVAEGMGHRDAVSVTRPVVSPSRLESAAVSGDTESAAGEALGKLDELRPDVGGLTLSVAPTALVGLAGGIDQLVEYPYGCTEQLTSRLVPLLPLRDLAKALGAPLPPEVDAAVHKTVAKVQQNQREDGGFGLWAESESSSPWLTSYALWGLATAKAHGVPVREGVLTAAKRYLHQSLTRDVEHDPASAAFIVDVLAGSGAPEPGAATRLFERRAELPTFAKALLLSALHDGGGDADAKQTLVTELAGVSRLDGPGATLTADARYHGLLDSDARATAMALYALAKAAPKHPLVPKLAVGLLAQRRGGKWRTTQETAWALLGLDAYRRAVEGVPPAFDARVFLGDAEVLRARFDGAQPLSVTQSTPMSRLLSAGGSVLAFEKKGEGRMFYEARLRFAPKRPLARAVDQGFFIDKSLAVVTRDTLPAAIAAAPAGVAPQIRAGDLVLVTLTVVAPSPRDYVVIDDPLPGGLEAVDTSLRGAARRLTTAMEEAEDGEADGRSWLWAPVTRRELRDDRALFFADTLPAGLHRYRYLARATSIGKFSMPAARVEEMYVPETFGHTPDYTLEVTAP